MQKHSSSTNGNIANIEKVNDLYYHRDTSFMQSCNHGTYLFVSREFRRWLPVAAPISQRVGNMASDLTAAVLPVSSNPGIWPGSTPEPTSMWSSAGQWGFTWLYLKAWILTSCGVLVDHFHTNPRNMFEAATDATSISPSGESFDLNDVPRLTHTHEEHGGPQWSKESPRALKASWINFMNPLLSGQRLRLTMDWSIFIPEDDQFRSI